MSVNAHRIVPFPSARAPYTTGTGRQPRSQRRPWLRAVVLLATAVYLVWAGSQLIRQEMRMRQLHQRFDQLTAVREQLLASNQSISQQIESLTKDPTYLEQLAREMGMVKPSDTVYLPVSPIR